MNREHGTKRDDKQHRPSRPTFEALEPRLLLNATISGQVWEDMNGNGLRDAGDVGVNGWTVELVDVETEAVVATTVSASDDLDGDGTIDPFTEMGHYSFTGMPDSSYVVRQVVQAGWGETMPAVDPLDLDIDVTFLTVLGGAEQYTDPFTMDQVWDSNYWAGLASRPWVWKMNDDYFNDVWVNQRTSSGFSAAALVPYTPGSDPNAYWFIIGDSWPGGYRGGVEDDFYDLDVKIVEDPLGGTMSVTAYRRHSIAQYYIVGPDGTEYLVPAGFGPEGPDNSISIAFDLPRLVQPGETVDGLGFGNSRLGTILGQKFEDVNGNGQRDAGEVGLDGWIIEAINVTTGVSYGMTVTASVDVDGDGAIDPETEAGLYSFDGLFPGTYTIRETMPAGWQQTHPTDSGQGRLFGMIAPPGAAPDISELDPDTGAVLNAFQAPVAVQNEFTWSALAAGETSIFLRYTSYVDDPRLVEIDIDTGVQIDADNFPSWLGVVSILDGMIYAPSDDGNAIIVWDPDLDQQVGTIDMSGWGYFGLVDMAGADDLGLLIAMAENASGSYIITIDPATGAIVSESEAHGEAPWFYRNGEIHMVQSGAGGVEVVRIDPLTGVVLGTLAWETGSYEAVGSQASVGVQRVELFSGDGALAVNFGNRLIQPGSIAGQLWEDTDFNGTQDAGEGALVGWTVELQNLLGETLTSTTTAADGSYELLPLPGNYLVHMVAPDGWWQTSQPAGGQGGDYFVMMTDSAALTDMDFGAAAHWSIAGQVVDDLDRDGRVDSGEAGLAFVEGAIWPRAELWDLATGQLAQSWDIADVDLNGDGQINPATESGVFKFEGFTPGQYEVRLALDDPAGAATWVATSADRQAMDIAYGQDVAGLDFTVAEDWREPVMTVLDNPLGAAGWELITDDDAYGGHYLQNAADADKGVAAFGGGMIAVQYRFTAPEDGDYVLSVRAPASDNSAPVVQVGLLYFSGGEVIMETLTWDQTQDAGQWVDLGVLAGMATGMPAYVYLLAAGTEGYIVNADAMRLTAVESVLLGSMSGRVFDDLNADGQRDPDEPGQDGWTVELVDSASGAVLATQLTQSADLDGDGLIDPYTEAGLYDFIALPAGDYTVRRAPTSPWGLVEHSVSIGSAPIQDLTGLDFFARHPVDELYANFGPVGLVDLAYDLDGDGDVDDDDVAVLIHDVLNTEFGDFNLDGVVGFADLTILGTYYGVGATWAEGDANGDRIVDLTDLTILGTFYGFDASADTIGASGYTATPTAVEGPLPTQDENGRQGAPLSLATFASADLGSSEPDVNLLAAWPTSAQGVEDQPAAALSSPAVTTGGRLVQARPLTLSRGQAHSRRPSMQVTTADTGVLSSVAGRPQAAQPAAGPSGLQADLVNILDEAELLAAL